jgi:tetratricopeptide (TPR) repeat protein
MRTNRSLSAINRPAAPFEPAKSFSSPLIVPPEQCKILRMLWLSRCFSSILKVPVVRADSFLQLLLLSIAPFAALQAQTVPSSNDSRVQELYAQAKAAEARGDLAGAAASYGSLLKIAPRLPAAYNNLGALYLRQREYKKAAEILEKGLKLDPKMSSATALLGIARYEMGDYTGARRNLEAALHANPKDDNAQLYLANDLIKLGELNAATDHLQQLSLRQPANQEIWYLLGKVHMKLSEQALSRLNEIDPNSVWVHEISGEIMESMKNYDGALVEYKKAVEMAPEQAGTHYSLGNAYWSLRMWDAATEQFKAELVNDPANCLAQWKIGNIVLEQHANSEEALADVDKALDICTNLMQARLDRARALINLDRHSEAVKDLEMVEKADPAEPSPHFLLAQAYRAMGRTQEAQAEMKIFSKLEESARAATAERAKQVLQEKNKDP